MSRATSASVYGSGTPTDLARVPAARPARNYGLRSGSSVTGYYPAYGSRPKAKRTRKEVVDATSNLVQPAVVDDDAPIRRFVRTDHDAERKSAGTIRMADF